MKRDKTPDALARHLSDAQILRAEVEAWQWTVTGPGFSELNELFDRVAERAQGAVDLIAQRIVQLGEIPPVSPSQWLELATVDCVTTRVETVAPMAMLEHLEANLSMMARSLLWDVERIHGTDPVSADILTLWSGAVETEQRLLRAPEIRDLLARAAEAPACMRELTPFVT